MSNELYRDRILERATSSDNLDARLKANQKASSRDFHKWVLGHLAPRPGEHVLDVGCGTGAQALPVAKAVGASGSVCALDFSAESVAALLGVSELGNIEAVSGTMDELEQIVTANFPRTSFDLTQSTYAIYYADDPVAVLEAMLSLTRDGGRMAVTVPALPHGLVELAGRFSDIPPQTLQSLSFGRDVLEPWFRERFWEPSAHFFKNTVSVASVDDLLASYRSTVYHVANAEAEMIAVAERAIRDQGAFVYQKNAMMLCATKGN